MGCFKSKIISIVLLTISLMLLSVAIPLLDIYFLDIRALAYDTGDVYFRLQHDTDPLAFKDKIETIEMFSSFEDELNSIKRAKYYELYGQPLYVDMTETNRENFFVEYTEDEEKKMAVPCIQLSLNIFDDFAIDINEGQSFNEECYNYSWGSTIPVILGNEYKGKYKVGDVFQANYLYSNFDFTVIGFLKPKSIIRMSLADWYLDKSIVMPSFRIIKFPNTNESYVTLKIHYANKISGVLKTKNENKQAIITELDKALVKSQVGKLEYYTSLSYLNYSRQGIHLKLLLALSTFLGIAVSIMSAFMMIRNQYKLKQIFIITLIPMFFAFAINIWIDIWLGMKFFTVPFSLAFTFIVLILSKMIIKKVNDAKDL